MNQNKGVLLVLSTAVISGFSIFVNQFGVKVIGSDIYTFLKNLVAGILVIAVLLLLREGREIKKLWISAKSRPAPARLASYPTLPRLQGKLTCGQASLGRRAQREAGRSGWKDLGLLSLIGLIGGSIPFLLFFKGLSISTAGNGSLIHKTMFLFVAVLAIIFLKEKLNKWLMSGILLMLIGNVFLLKFNTQVILNRGDLLILIATLLWAVENILSKKALSYISPRIVGASRMLLGCLFIMIYLIITGQFSQLGHLNISQLAWVWLTGVILTAYILTWYSGLKYVNVSTASCLLALGAPVTTILTLIQGQPLVINKFLGLALLFGGAVLIVIAWRLTIASSEQIK